ncbi:chalcone-flavanone isomerase-domain-containing protein [Dichotomocladium elegans]|nr:chalcone-flavanone isomerase-domain-containing protein [Dichotomocladium elegans]
MQRSTHLPRLLSRATGIRQAFRQSQSRIHTSVPPVSITRSPHIAGWTTTALIAAGGYYAWTLSVDSPVLAEASYEGTVQEPSTKLVFPINLQTGSEWTRLVGLGPRTVSFLKLNVYVLGLYMRSEDIGTLKTIKGWEHFDKGEFLASEKMSLALLQQPVDVSIRIVPARGTNMQHLRDGFTRAILQRMRSQSQDMSEEKEREILKAIQEFKSLFPLQNIKRGTEFIFTKTKDGGLKMEFEGKDLGTVKNDWLAVNFVMGYLNPTAPASEDARQNIAQGFDTLLNPKA